MPDGRPRYDTSTATRPVSAQRPSFFTSIRATASRSTSARPSARQHSQPRARSHCAIARSASSPARFAVRQLSVYDGDGNDLELPAPSFAATAGRFFSPFTAAPFLERPPPVRRGAARMNPVLNFLSAKPHAPRAEIDGRRAESPGGAQPLNAAPRQAEHSGKFSNRNQRGRGGVEGGGVTLHCFPPAIHQQRRARRARGAPRQG